MTGFMEGENLKNFLKEGYEYINWITGKHEEFKKRIGLDGYAPYTKEQEEKFLEFINSSR